MDEQIAVPLRHLSDAPHVVLRPAEQRLPFIFASPHSGRMYPSNFVKASRLPLHALRRSEDSYVDEIFASAAELGAPLLSANFPRAYIDPNREPYELDPAMFQDPLPAYVNTRSLRVAGGLGTLARVVSDGALIYNTKLKFSEAERRINRFYLPYHTQLAALIAETKERFGFAVLIDCHSMPSIGGPMDDDDGLSRADIVLGDRFGTACAPSLTRACERALRDLGLATVRNIPYAGGYTTDHYGRPGKHVHAIQIEINRALYMNEATLERNEGLIQLRHEMRNFIINLRDQLPTLFHLPTDQAAE